MQDICLERNKFSIIIIIILSPLLQVGFSYFVRYISFCTTFLLCNKINFICMCSLNLVVAVNVRFSFSYQVFIFTQQQKILENSTSQPQDLQQELRLCINPKRRKLILRSLLTRWNRKCITLDDKCIMF